MFAPVAIKGLLLAVTLSTDLFSLLGGGGESSTLGKLNGHFAGQIRVLCTTPEAVAAVKQVAEFRETPPPAEIAAYYTAHGGGLLSDKDRKLLEDGQYAKVRRAIMRMDYGGVGLTDRERDPYYFVHGYLTTLLSRLPKPGGTILYGEANHIPELVELAQTRDDVFLSGAPFHAYLATRASVAEINLLSIVSVLLALAIGFWLHRNFRFVVPLLLTLLAGFAAGTAALFACFSAPHVLTFLFGTSLIGLGVDYCYHGKSRNLAKALLTSLIAFSPLLFSHVAVLNQMAVFTMAGLAAIYLCVSLRS